MECARALGHRGYNVTLAEKNKELEELADWLVHEMSEAIDNTINAKYMEMDLDEDDEEFETGLDDYEFEQFKENLAESISMDAIVSSEEFGTVELVKAALSHFEKENRTDWWQYEVLENALVKAIKWDEENE